MKKLNRQQVFKLNRNLTQTMIDIQNQVYDLDGYEGYNVYNSNPAFDGVEDRLKDIQKALHALKKELYEMSEPKTKEQA
ncbi:MAG: hypothetical protein AAF403_00115 [Pseudomonadota bacterium]